MSIASQLTALEGNISDAYDMVAQRGGTVPARKNMENLDDAIATIPSGGGSFSGIPRATTNGRYCAPGDSFAFSVPSDTTILHNYSLAYAFYKGGNSSQPMPGVTSATFPSTDWTAGPSCLIDAFYGCTNLTSVDLSGLKSSWDYSFSSAFYGCTSLTGALDLSNLTTISGAYSFSNAFDSCAITSVDLSGITSVTYNYAFNGAFFNCTHITTMKLDSLQTVSGQYGFKNFCTSNSNMALTSISLPALTTVSGREAFSRAFYHCNAATTLDIGNLKTVSAQQAMYQAFMNCTSLTSVTLTKLDTITGNRCLAGMFYGCTSLTSLSFPALTTSSFGSYTNQFNQMLSGVTGCTVHFPAAVQSKIGSWADVTGGFGGTNTTVLFDL